MTEMDVYNLIRAGRIEEVREIFEYSHNGILMIPNQSHVYVSLDCKQYLLAGSCCLAMVFSDAYTN